MKKWIKTLLIILVSLLILTGAGYLFLRIKIKEIKSAIGGSELQSENFCQTINFDYISNWIVVKAKIEGSDKEYDFIFDTGAQTVFADSLLKNLHPSDYKMFSVRTDTNEHAFRDEIITMNRIWIGDLEFRNAGAIVVNNSEYDMLNCISPYGIIGYNILKNCIWQIDYARKQITITDQAEMLEVPDNTAWIEYKNLYSQETPVINVKINNTIDAELLLDTGYSGCVNLSSSDIYNKIIQAYPGNAERYTVKPGITIAGGKNAEPYEKVLLKTEIVDLGGVSLENLDITMADIEEGSFTGLMGNKFLENYIITADYINKRIGFTPLSDTPEREPNKSYGFSYSPSGGKMYISSVYKDSEAAKKGIVVGDEILSINDLVIQDLSSEELCSFYRGEFSFTNKKDTVISLELLKNGKISAFSLKKYQLFK